eukprot:20045_1
MRFIPSLRPLSFEFHHILFLNHSQIASNDRSQNESSLLFNFHVDILSLFSSLIIFHCKSCAKTKHSRFDSFFSCFFFTANANFHVDILSLFSSLIVFHCKSCAKPKH